MSGGENLSSETINEIFNATKNQHLSPMWKMQRVGALTASTLHRAARYKENDPDNYIVKDIMGRTTVFGNKATAYGHKHEPIARKLYEKSMKSKHKCFKVKNLGLIISSAIPVVRASPDGVISCKCCGKGLLEIKCPYSK